MLIPTRDETIEIELESRVDEYVHTSLCIIT